MKKEFVIKVKDFDGIDYFLEFDSKEGGTPFWSLKNTKRFSDLVNISKYIGSIKNCAKRKDGSFYNSNLNFSTLSICEIGIINDVLIGLEDEEELVIENIKTKLSEEELNIFKKYILEGGVI